MAAAIYLDNNATTPADERVVEALVDALRTGWGNPSSAHGFGERAAAAVAEARASVARLVGARSPREIVFTASGTEASNAAIHAALADPDRVGARRLVLTSPIEHASVRRPLEAWARRGFRIETAGLDADGRIDAADVLGRLAARGGELALVSLMVANNETGAILTEEELAAIGHACRSHGVPFHVDAVQAPGKLPLDLPRLGVDLASLAAHKFHGPQGVGALYVGAAFERERPLSPLLLGGSQERDRRAGTLNVAGIAGMGKAAELAREHVAQGGPAAVAALRERLEAGLAELCPEVAIHGRGAPRLPNTTSARFPRADGEILVGLLAERGLAVSTGAACSAERRAPSPVLLALGLTPAEASATLRFSLSRRTSAAEVDAALAILAESLAELAALAGPAPR